MSISARRQIAALKESRSTLSKRASTKCVCTIFWDRPESATSVAHEPQLHGKCGHSRYSGAAGIPRTCMWSNFSEKNGAETLRFGMSFVEMRACEEHISR
jgi:hypothetical protein